MRVLAFQPRDCYNLAQVKLLKDKISFSINLSFAVWLIGFLIFAGYVVAFNINEKLTDNLWLTISILLVVLVSCFSFLVGSIIYVCRKIYRQKNKNKLIEAFLFLSYFLVLPIFYLWEIFNPVNNFRSIRSEGLKFFKKERLKKGVLKISSFIVVTGLVLPVWLSAYFLAVYIPAYSVGLIAEDIPLAGTGSMYPTFPKGVGEDPVELGKQTVATAGMTPYPNGINLFGKNFFGHTIGRGDIVLFENDLIRKITKETYGEESGYVKRVVALSGDRIEIRDGIFFLNGDPQKESYTASPRSTFGGDFLNECTEITVPQNKLFVMGDNRKGSGDSRHDVGFVDIKDVNHVLPYDKQIGVVDKLWRDSSNDLEESAKVRLDKEEYLKLLNEEREKAGVNGLRLDDNLSESARLRGEVMIEFNDFSFEAIRSGYTVVEAMSDADYSNIVWGEAPSQGYYTAEELFEYQLSFADTKEFLLDPDFDDIGISEVEGQINGCPTQVIVQHFGGYVPPSYTQADIDSWKQALEGLQGIRDGWLGLKSSGGFYLENKVDIDRINQIIDLRISNINKIVARMEANQWLSEEEERAAEQDLDLYYEQDSLATKLNNL